MSVLRLKDLQKAYGPVKALDGVSLDVRPGSRTAIVGPSGSGKTTLLRMIAGFDAPDRGSIHLGDTCLADGPNAVPAHRRGIGIVAQDGALFPHLSIRQNIGFGLPRDVPGRDALIASLLEMVGLDASMLPRRPDQLSGGQQQRVALARALARKPKLMLLDEPFSALDTGLRVATRKAVANLLTEQGITTILVTHDQGEALTMSDRVAVFNNGDLRGGAAAACTCRIDEVEFGGASSLITLRVQAPDGSHPGTSFVLRRSGLDNMRMGETVALRINGTAHAFPKLT